MKQYEYDQVLYNSSRDKGYTLISILNSKGLKGWELIACDVQIHPNEFDYHLIFKRLITPERLKEMEKETT